MTTPTPFEQLTVELINRARLNPSDEFDLWVTNAPQNIVDANAFFGVDLVVLKQQFDALTPAAPLAWNRALGTAALAHTQEMLDHDEQSHQLPGEPDLDVRVTNAGYIFSTLGENVYAFAQDADHSHAGFFIDWGNTPTGIQDPPGHRDSIMRSNFTEVGVGHLTDNDPTTQVGPHLVTHNFGNRFGYTAQITGVIFDDADGDRFYDIGEGIGGTTITSGAASATNFFSGGYNLAVAAGVHMLVFDGPMGTAAIIVTLGTENIKVDMFDTGSFRSSVSATLGAGAIAVELLGEAAIEATGNDLDNVFIGNLASNTLTGGPGNDLLDGRNGIDSAVYSAPQASYTAVRLANGAIRITDNRDGSPDGIDTVRNVEQWQFQDGLVATGDLVDPPDHGPAPSDFNSDGISDVLFQSASNGAVVFWFMNGENFTQTGLIGGGGDPSWKAIFGGGDFDGDGSGDILWQHQGSGAVTLWFVDGESFTQPGLIGGDGDPNWKILNIGDFDGDGKTDIVWQHQVSGAVSLWFMDGASFTQPGLIGGDGDPNWRILDVGDFDGNGKTDILWQHQVSGAVTFWFMDGADFTQPPGLIGGEGDPNWRIIDVGDFDGDGKTDILWQHLGNGTVTQWFMDGTNFVQGGVLAGPGAGFASAATGDYDGDGRFDVLWQHAATGAVVAWFVDGETVTPAGPFGGGDPDWLVV